MSHSIDREKYPETAKFADWFEKEKLKGLVDIKFVTEDLTGATVESFCKEINEALAAPMLEDKELI